MNAARTKRQSSLLSFWNQPNSKKNPKYDLNEDKIRNQRGKEDEELASIVSYETSIDTGKSDLEAVMMTKAVPRIKTEKIMKVKTDNKRFDSVVSVSTVSTDISSTDHNSYEQETILPKVIKEDEKNDISLHGASLKSENDFGLIEDKNNDYNGLSPYELMRLERIKRNEERLIKLGLMSSNGTSSIQQSVNQNRKRRQKPVTKSRFSSSHYQVPPIRRSTRIKRTTGAFIDDGIQNESKKKVEDTTNVDIQINNIKEEEIQYQVSPIVEYAIEEKFEQTSTIHCSTSLSKDENFQCPQSFSEAGPKLIPPAGLTAIYSLQFCPDYNEKSILLYDDDSPQSRRYLDKNLIECSKSCKNTNLIVGAGKSGIISIWHWHLHSKSQKFCAEHSPHDTTNIHEHHGQSEIQQNSTDSSCMEIHPMLSWKGHKNRWIASAQFLPPIYSSSSEFVSKNLTRRENSPNTSFYAPSLITAGNDGAVCLWDLSSVSVPVGVPKLIFNNKTLHTSGIFAMDTNLSNQNLLCDIDLSLTENILICTGSKDKTIAVSKLKEMIVNVDDCDCILWKSEYHAGKVSSVAMRGIESSLLLSASDDGNIAIHDYRINSMRNGLVVSELTSAHTKPHSVEWNPITEHEFMTAGHDSTIKTWDMRHLGKPLCAFHGHVPNISRHKRIHHPQYYLPFGRHQPSASYIITGGERSSSLSLFQNKIRNDENTHTRLDTQLSNNVETVFSRGSLPNGSGDAGSIAAKNKVVAISVDGGEVLLLSPTKS